MTTARLRGAMRTHANGEMFDVGASKEKWLDRLESMISFGLVLNLFLMRPAALGQSFTWLAMVSSVTLVGAYIVSSWKRRAPTQPGLRFEMAILFFLVLAYWLYEGPVSLMFNRSNLGFAAKELLTTIAILVPYGIFLLGTRTNQIFFRQFCTVVSLLGFSTLVTTLLTLLLGSRDPLFLFTLNVKGYSGDTIDQTAAVGAVYFPLSMLYTDFVAGAVTLDRYCGFFREAGIYQAIACFCLIYEFFTRRSKLVMLGLIAGSILTFSSLGIVLLASALGLIFILASRRFLALRVMATVIALGSVYPMAMYTPYIGLKDKSATHGSSLSDRSQAISTGLERAGENPFGYGVYSSQSSNIGICLLSSIGGIGIFGFACQAMALSGWRPGKRSNWRKVVACAPILVTALVSEPIAGEPAAYIFVMAYLPIVRREARALTRYDKLASSVGTNDLGMAAPAGRAPARTHAAARNS